ncbi:MAG: DEDD exonuclease domain-containing protein [Actinomycetota bacterium]
MAITTQRSFEELGTPLAEVTFCVVDLETTGGSHMDSITEIGAVKVCRGEVVGTFQSLVNPGQAVPAFIRLLTGIDDEMLTDAPAIDAVLPSFLGFVGDSVIVAHNARFDIGFLNGALAQRGYPLLDNRVVDTALLARKILAGEVPNHKLSTLAAHLRCAHRPTHRAFADVLATVDVLHHLIERVAGFGVTTLEDLVAISATKMDGTFSKIRMTDDLPSKTGIYRFVGNDKTLYVGKATDIRSRVRSYFYGDPRRRIKDLLRETDSIEATVFPTLIEAEIAEARAIASEMPPYNRAGKRERHWYVRVTGGRAPKIAAARVPKPGRDLYLGPFSSMSTVRVLMDALRDAARLHRCTDPKKCGECPYSRMGSCAGPEAQRAEVRLVAAAIAGDARPPLGKIHDRMRQLARAERFEEADEVRRRGSLLETSLRAAVEAHALALAGDIVIAVGRRALLLRDRRLAAASDIDADEATVVRRLIDETEHNGCPLNHLSPQEQTETKVISAWLRRGRDEVRILHASGPWALPVSIAPTDLFSVKKTS